MPVNNYISSLWGLFWLLLLNVILYFVKKRLNNIAKEKRTFILWTIAIGYFFIIFTIYEILGIY